jgi:hypothetical protein
VGSTVYGKVNKLSNIHYYVQYAVVGERIFSFRQTSRQNIQESFPQKIKGIFGFSVFQVSKFQQIQIGFLKPASYPKSLMMKEIR